MKESGNRRRGGGGGSGIMGEIGGARRRMRGRMGGKNEGIG